MNKPFREALSLANFADAQAAWRQWYDEIKDGKRTFRFEGDPAEYDLDGPAPARKLERIALAEKRDAERGRERVPGGTAADDAVPAMAGDGDGEGLPAAVSIAAAAFLCLSAGWYLVRRRGTGRAEWRR